MSSIIQRNPIIWHPGRGQRVRPQVKATSGPSPGVRSARKGGPIPNGSDISTMERSFRTVLRKETQQMAASSNEGTSSSEKATEWIRHTVKKGDTLWALAVRKYHVNLNDLIRDNGITDPRALQPGQELKVRVNRHPAEEVSVMASWYGEPYHGRPMANGEIYNMHAATIAHPSLPLGTQVELKNPETGVKAKAVITDRGPFIKGREVDLSYGLAKKLSFVEKGVGKLLMRILGKRETSGTPSEFGSRTETSGRQGA